MGAFVGGPHIGMIVLRPGALVWSKKLRDGNVYLTQPCTALHSLIKNWGTPSCKRGCNHPIVIPNYSYFCGLHVSTSLATFLLSSRPT